MREHDAIVDSGGGGGGGCCCATAGNKDNTEAHGDDHDLSPLCHERRCRQGSDDGCSGMWLVVS